MATNLEFIKKVKAQEVASVEITDIFSDRYDKYIIKHPHHYDTGTTDQRLQMLDSSGTAITTSIYKYATLNLNSNTGSSDEYNNASDHTRSFSYLTPSYYQSGLVELEIYNPYNSASYTYWSWRSNYYQSGTSRMESRHSIGYIGDYARHTGIKIYAPSANWIDFQLEVYGVS